MKRSGGSGPAITRQTRSAIPSNRCDDPCALEYFTNSVVTLIGNKQIARFIEGDTGGSTELRTGCRTAIPRKAGCPTAGIRRDYSSPRSNLANAIVGIVGDVEIT